MPDPHPNLPQHLAQKQARGGVPDETVAQFEIGDGHNFVYLILDWQSSERKAAIIDPQADLSLPLEWLEKNAFRLETILLTHTHSDHTAGVPGLLRAIPGLKVMAHAHDAHRLRHKWPTESLVDQQIIPVGNIPVKALHTPGHTAGGFCYFLEARRHGSLNAPVLFSGDTVFIENCGRTDLEGGSDAAMFASLQKLRSLPADTIILPGHHYSPPCATTLSQEIASSPPFLARSVDELKALP